MRASGDVAENDAFEIAGCDAAVVKEHIVAVQCKVLENRQRPRDVRPAIAEKYGLLDTFHRPLTLRTTEIERYQKTETDRGPVRAAPGLPTKSALPFAPRHAADVRSPSSAAGSGHAPVR